MLTEALIVVVDVMDPTDRGPNAMIADREDELVGAVEVGDAPLAVFADWLEERGDERAVGVRWLAEHDRRPRFDAIVDSRGEPRPASWKWHLTTHATLAHQIPWPGPGEEWLERFGGRFGVVGFGSFAAALSELARVLSAAITTGELR